MGVRVESDRWVAVEDALPLVRILLVRYGSIPEAGRAYDERYGYKGRYVAHRNGGHVYSGNGSRLFNRILSGETQSVSDRTYDQIETLVWS